MIRTLAQSVPPKWRTAIYSTLATLVGLEAIFDVVPAGIESKILAALVVLGFLAVVSGYINAAPFHIEKFLEWVEPRASEFAPAIERHPALRRAAPFPRRALERFPRAHMTPPLPPYAPDHFASDDFHPSAHGYGEWAEFIVGDAVAHGIAAQLPARARSE
jgi:hypothetical protein